MFETDPDSTKHDYSVTIPCPKLGDSYAVTLARAGKPFRRHFTVTMLDYGPDGSPYRRFAYPCRSDRYDLDFVETSVTGMIMSNGVNATDVQIPVPSSWILTTISAGVSFWHPPELIWDGRKFSPKPEKEASKKG